MHPRTTILLTLLFALRASAQAPEGSLPPPPVVSAEVPEATPPGCGVCAEGAQCVEGRCQFVCDTDRDCHRGLICVREGGPGHCGPKTFQRPGSPPTIRRADPTHAERYRFSSVVPPGFHLVSEPLWGLFAGGVVAFAVSYLPFAILGPLGGRPLDAIPFIGPILAFRPSSGWFSGFVDFVAIVGIALDVVVQLGGAAAVIGAFAAPKQWLERDDDNAPAVTFSIVPGATGAPLGASLLGRF